MWARKNFTSTSENGKPLNFFTFFLCPLLFTVSHIVISQTLNIHLLLHLTLPLPVMNKQLLFLFILIWKICSTLCDTNLSWPIIKQFLSVKFLPEAVTISLQLLSLNMIFPALAKYIFNTPHIGRELPINLEEKETIKDHIIITFHRVVWSPMWVYSIGSLIARVSVFLWRIVVSMHN